MVNTAVGPGCSGRRDVAVAQRTILVHRTHHFLIPENHPPITKLKVLLGKKILFCKFLSQKIWGG